MLPSGDISPPGIGSGGNSLGLQSLRFKIRGHLRQNSAQKVFVHVHNHSFPILPAEKHFQP